EWMRATGWLILKFADLPYVYDSFCFTRQACFRRRSEFRLQSGGERNQVVTYRSRFCDRILECYVRDLGATKPPHPAKFSLVHQIDGSRAITGGKHAVVRRR